MSSSSKKSPRPSFLRRVLRFIQRSLGIRPPAAKPHAKPAHRGPRFEDHEGKTLHTGRRPPRSGNTERSRGPRKSGGGAGRPATSSEESNREPRGKKRSGGSGRGGRSAESCALPVYAPLPVPMPPPVPEGPYPPAFEELGLSPAVLAGIRESGYEQPTEIQRRAIPEVLAGKDVVGASQTGTGKTAAFALPTISKLGAPGGFRCLILEPTRELAAQVVEQLQLYGKHTGLRSLLVHGGVGYDKQRRGLMEGVDIVVATPGRLLDFISDGTAKLDGIEILILDEVDRMLDMGFLPDVRRIVERIPKQRQTLFFSATMPPQIQTLADFALQEPVSIEIGIRFSPADTVSHYMYPVASDQRQELLLAILEATHYESVMIFTRTKAQADELHAVLQADGGHKVAIMHSDIRQSERERALQGFRDGSFEVIVATDLAARGLDVSGVTHVINFMVPENAEDYVHRIGRTGRAKKEGDAFTLFSAEELPNVESIERLINQKIERRKLDGFAYKYTTVLDDEARTKAILTGRGKRKGRRR